MDYKALLKKYMAVYRYNEGGAFIPQSEDNEFNLSLQELEELNRIEDELINES